MTSSPGPISETIEANSSADVQEVVSKFLSNPHLSRKYVVHFFVNSPFAANLPDCNALTM